MYTSRPHIDPEIHVYLPTFEICEIESFKSQQCGPAYLLATVTSQSCWTERQKSEKWVLLEISSGNLGDLFLFQEYGMYIKLWQTPR